MHLHGPVSLGVVKDEELTKEIPDVQAIVHTFNRFRDNPLIIEFPLLELSKAEIYSQIDPFLTQRITFRQNHGPDLCGRFNPVKMMKPPVPTSIHFSRITASRLLAA